MPGICEGEAQRGGPRGHWARPLGAPAQEGAFGAAEAVFIQRDHRAAGQRTGKVRGPRGTLAEVLKVDPAGLKAQFHNEKHHRAYMASSSSSRCLRRPIVLAIDDFWNFASTMFGRREANHLGVSHLMAGPMLGAWTPSTHARSRVRRRKR